PGGGRGRGAGGRTGGRRAVSSGFSGSWGGSPRWPATTAYPGTPRRVGSGGCATKASSPPAGDIAARRGRSPAPGAPGQFSASGQPRRGLAGPAPHLAPGTLRPALGRLARLAPAHRTDRRRTGEYPEESTAPPGRLASGRGAHAGLLAQCRHRVAQVPAGAADVLPKVVAGVGAGLLTHQCPLFLTASVTACTSPLTLSSVCPGVAGVAARNWPRPTSAITPARASRTAATISAAAHAGSTRARSRITVATRVATP